MHVKIVGVLMRREHILMPPHPERTQEPFRIAYHLLVRRVLVLRVGDNIG
jgi:hypothetical protein